MDLWGGLWLAGYIGAFLGGGGNAVYYFHYLPLPMEPGHNGSPGTFGFFSADNQREADGVPNLRHCDVGGGCTGRCKFSSSSEMDCQPPRDPGSFGQVLVDAN